VKSRKLSVGSSESKVAANKQVLSKPIKKSNFFSTPKWFGDYF